MDNASLWSLLSILLGGVATIAIFSFLIKENLFYRFFEHLFIGIAAAIGPMLIVRDFLWPEILSPMLGLGVDVYPDGTLSQPYQPLYLLYLIPMAFGSLYYCLYSKRYAWLAKIVIGFSLGVSGALSIKGFFAETVPQLQGSFKPLLVTTNEGIAWFESFNNSLFVVTLLLVLNYFFFTFGRGESVQAKIAPLGRPLLMVCFGAFFGSTVMARLALLVERVQFVLHDWVRAVGQIIGFSG
jgi:hypothetical protein